MAKIRDVANREERFIAVQEADDSLALFDVQKSLAGSDLVVQHVPILRIWLPDGTQHGGEDFKSYLLQVFICNQRLILVYKFAIMAYKLDGEKDEESL